MKQFPMFTLNLKHIICPYLNTQAWPMMSSLPFAMIADSEGPHWRAGRDYRYLTPSAR